MATPRDPGFCAAVSAYGFQFDKIAVGPLRLGERLNLNDSWFPSQPRRGNFVEPFIYGECAFDAMAVAFTTAISPDHRIYILGWGLDLSTPMLLSQAPGQPTKTFWQLISEADTRRVPVRAMLYRSLIPFTPDPNGTPCNSIDGLNNGGAIHDGWLIPPLANQGPGVHHQKVVVVSGSAGVLAFIGGMDIQPDRILQPNTPPPMHDVHLKVQGPVTADIRKIFVQRWDDHPDHSAHDNKGGQPTIPSQDPSFALPALFQSAKRQLCAVGRTYPNGAKHGMARSYSFAPGGEYTAWGMIARAIQLARQYIYIEDQYLVSDRTSQALAAKLQSDKGFKRIIILTNPVAGLVASDLPHSEYLRARFLLDLQAVDPKGLRWSIFVLKGSANQEALQTRGTMVHSKLWIFDDRYAIIGSANCEERGYTYDSECVLGVAEDDFFPETRLGFAHKLRMMLWSKHSLVPVPQLLDWQSALRVWDAPAADSMIARYNAASDLGPAVNGQASPGIDYILANFIEPRGD